MGAEIDGTEPSQVLLLILLIAPFVQGILFGTLWILPKRSLGILSAFCSFIHFGITLYLVQQMIERDPATLSIRWFPEALVYFSLRADGLALFFALLITGMGGLVSLYAHGYMDHAQAKIRRFYAYMNIFSGAMLGAVLADNLILLFLFWEVTSVTSYLLISYQHEKEKARKSARGAFLLNAAASLCLLLGFILIGVLNGSMELSVVEEMGIVYGRNPLWIFSIITLLLVGVYAKSAQFPFHFWLPEAMAAPTPVSAYLHSATMVKLGIYLTARIYVLFVDSELWTPLVTSLSLVTVLVGGFWALSAIKLKKILAFATVSQLGFFISFYGLADSQGLQYDYVHIFNHALYKGSLFMLIGILGHSCEATQIYQIRGVAKQMPLFGVIFALSLAAMAGLPGTTGFLSKELLIADLWMLVDEGYTGVLAFSVLLIGLLFKIAFTFRLFHHAFIQKPNRPVTVTQKPSLMLLFPPFVLSLIAFILGVWPEGLKTLEQTFIVKGLHSGNPPEIYLWHGFSLTLFTSLVLFASGVLLQRVMSRTRPRWSSLKIPSFSLIWNLGLDVLPYVARWMTRFLHSARAEVQLRWIFLFLSLDIAVSIFFKGPAWPRWDFVSLQSAAELLCAMSVGVLLYLRRPFDRLILLSVIGFLVTFYFVLKQGADVAMTQMVIEVATLFVIILLFSRLPEQDIATHSWVRGIIAVVSGLAVASIPLFHGVMVNTAELGEFFVTNALPLAKGSNTVNTILVDFRGLDTLGEVAVIVVAALGVAGLCVKREELSIHHFPSLIPSPALPALMPSLFVITSAFGVYLLLRGHNDPGGGFVGGMAPALAFILVGMAMEASRLFLLHKLNPFRLMMAGLALALVAASFSIVYEGQLFVSYFSQSVPLINIPLVFDTGICLIVIGAVIGMVYSMRERTLWESQK